MGLTKKLMIFNIILTISVVGVLSGLLFVFPAEVEASYNISPTINQVKTADSPTVYYLDHNRGKKKAYVNEAAFLAYGNNWGDIKTVSQSELASWRDINLVKTKNSPTVYYIRDGGKAPILNEAEFLNAGFFWSDIVTVFGVDLAAYVLTEFKAGGGSDNSVNNNPQLFVETETTGPAGTTLPFATKDNLLAVFALRAQKETAEIKSLTLTLGGVFNPSALEKIYLTNEAGVVYDIPVSVKNKKATFYFRNFSLLVQAGGEKKLKIFADFANYQDGSGSTLQISITGPSDIEIDTPVSGNFPVRASLFNLVPAGNLLGQVIVEENLLGASEAIVGSAGQTLSRFTIHEIANNEDLVVKEITLINNGSAGDSDLSNFKLKNKGGGIISSVAAMDRNNAITFKLNNYKISKNDEETFTVIGDIDGGEGRNFNFDLEEIKVAGQSYGFNLKPGYLNINETITIKRETLAVVAKELKNNNRVFSEQKGVIIGVFEIRNNNQRIGLDSLSLSLEKEGGAVDLTKTIYLVDYETGKVYSSFSGDNFAGGQVRVDLGLITLNPNNDLTLALITDMPREIENGDSYQVTLNKINYQTEAGRRYTDEINVAGARLNVSRTNIYIYSSSGTEEVNFTKGEKDVKIASFIIETAAGSDALIDSITLAKGSSSGVISFANGFSNLRVYIGSRRNRNIIARPTAGDYVFSEFNYRLRAGDRVEIKVYVDTEEDLKVSETDLKIVDLVATSYGSNISATVNGAGAASYKAVFGQVSAEIELVSMGNIASGEKNNLAATFRIKNLGSETLKLSSLTINTNGQGFSYSLGYSNLRAEERGTGKRVGSRITKPVAGANKINLGNYKIEASEEIMFGLYVDASQEVAESDFSIYLSNLEAYGYNSKIKARTSGDPTESFDFNIAASHSFIWPVNGKITYSFHDPNYPFRNLGEHSGIDIEVKQNTKVKAAAAGTITEAVDGGENGYSYIVINHNNGLYTIYGHLSRVEVTVGEQVSQGENIGRSGGQIGAPGSGENTTGPHLHFEVQANGVPVDPLDYLN